MKEDELLELYEQFLDGIEADGYKIIPTKSQFAKSLDVRPSKLYYWLGLHKHCEAKMRDMTADVIASGAMLKKYVPQASALALKNWCGWEDSPKTSKEAEKQSVRKEKKAADALDEYMKELRVKPNGKKERSASHITS